MWSTLDPSEKLQVSFWQLGSAFLEKQKVFCSMERQGNNFSFWDTGSYLFLPFAAFCFIDDAKKTEHLLALGGAKERLQLFRADLLDEGSFDSVVEGSECVFHTASPFYFTVNDPQVLSCIYSFVPV